MVTAVQYNRQALAETKPRMSYSGGKVFVWQQKAKEKLRELLGLDRFQKVDPQLEIEYDRAIEGGREIRFSFQSEEGYRVPCHLVLPEGVSNPPVMIALQGHSTGMHISLGNPKYESDERTIKGGDRDFCVRALKEGYASIAVEQRNFGECGGNEKGPDCFQSAMTALLCGRTTIGERVWDIQRLIDVLESDFGHLVDLKKICCMGNSGGGTATAYLMALEERVVLAMPSCAMCTYRDSIGAMHHCACNYVPDIANWFDMNDLMAMAAPKYYIQVSGMEDGIFPIAGAEEVFLKGKRAYDALGESDKCILVKGEGGHRFYADDAWPFVHKFLGI
ncbi:MAG: hypothetical protein IJE90_08015 [Clostridia bacterium]|nr:hypothetical protein [Clostridia bacterium]